MNKKIKLYIFLNFFKYLLINSLFFVGLVWISQALRIIDLDYIQSEQILKILIVTLMALPSYINPLLPILIIFTSIALNFKFTNSNENLIINQYLNKKEFQKILNLFFLFTFLFFISNKEFLAPKAYETYKVNELEIRNKLKLGFSSKHEFHIENELSLFFENNRENNFKNVRAIIYDQSRFISSKEAILEFNDQNFNIVFLNGERVILNELEKSYTKFEKFTYSIINKKVEKLFYDKDHFNTIELIKSNEKSFNSYGHNQVYQYILLVVILIISQKIIFFKSINKSLFKNFFNLIAIILVLITINAFLQYSLNQNDISIAGYYIINLISLIIFFYYSNKKYAN